MQSIIQEGLQVQDVGLSKDEQDILLTVLGEKYEAIENMLKQTSDRNIKKEGVIKTNYLIGVYNGLAMSKAIITGVEPEFYKEEQTHG